MHASKSKQIFCLFWYSFLFCFSFCVRLVTVLPIGKIRRVLLTETIHFFVLGWNKGRNKKFWRSLNYDIYITVQIDFGKVLERRNVCAYAPGKKMQMFGNYCLWCSINPGFCVFMLKWCQRNKEVLHLLPLLRAGDKNALGFFNKCVRVSFWWQKNDKNGSCVRCATTNKLRCKGHALLLLIGFTLPPCPKQNTRGLRKNWPLKWGKKWNELCWLYLSYLQPQPDLHEPKLWHSWRRVTVFRTKAKKWSWWKIEILRMKKHQGLVGRVWYLMEMMRQRWSRPCELLRFRPWRAESSASFWASAPVSSLPWELRACKYASLREH